MDVGLEIVQFHITSEGTWERQEKTDKEGNVHI